MQTLCFELKTQQQRRDVCSEKIKFGKESRVGNANFTTKKRSDRNEWEWEVEPFSRPASESIEMPPSIESLMFATNERRWLACENHRTDITGERTEEE